MFALALVVTAIATCIAVPAAAQTTPPVTVPAEWETAFGTLEAALGRLGTAAEERYRSVPCPSASVCGAADQATCSLPACGESFPATKGFQCLAGFGNSSALCDCAQGLRRSTSESTVMIPPGAEFNDVASQRFVCATKGLDAAFRQEFTSATLKGFQYVTDLKGLTRVFPGMAQQRNSGVCDTFDVRRRPWFASALSGPKNVVFVIDSSGSMAAVDGAGRSTRMQLVKEAMVHLLGTLTARDNVDVVDFDSSASSLGGGALRPATIERVSALMNSVNNVAASGGTLFVPAFNLAFQELAAASASNTCRNIVVFLTDGINSDNEASAVVNGQALLPNGKKAHMMTFSMSDGADQTKPRRLACENQGVWTHIGTNDDPSEKLVAYTDFLRFATIDSTVRWTSPYLDAFGLGYTVTAARTITITNGAASSVAVVGVVAADLPLSSIVGAAAASDINIVTQVESYLNARSNAARCPTGIITDCKLEQLRATNNGASCLTGTAATACANENSDILTASTGCASSTLFASGINGAMCTHMSATTRIPTAPIHATSRDLQCCSRPVDQPLVSGTLVPISTSGACAVSSNSSAAAASPSSTISSNVTAALQAFDFDTACDRIAACERNACACLNPLATYRANGTTVSERCPPSLSAMMLMNSSCTSTAGCVSDLAACVRTVWNSYSVNPSGLSTTCRLWGSRIQAVLNVPVVNQTTTTAVRSMCERSFGPWTCLNSALVIANTSTSRRLGLADMLLRRQVTSTCTITACDVGCDAFQLAAPAPTPIPPGALGPGGVSFGNTNAAPPVGLWSAVVAAVVLLCAASAI